MNLIKNVPFVVDAESLPHIRLGSTKTLDGEGIEPEQKFRAIQPRDQNENLIGELIILAQWHKYPKPGYYRNAGMPQVGAKIEWFAAETAAEKAAREKRAK